jgi:hypothetical protein
VKKRICIPVILMVALFFSAGGALAAPNKSPYLLDDEFRRDRAAGTVDGSLTESGQPRTVIDTRNKVSISNGKLVLAGGWYVWGDPIVLYPRQQRAAKGLYVWQVCPTSTVSYTAFEIGLLNDLPLLLVPHSIYFANGEIHVVNDNVVSDILGTYTAGMNYFVCIAPKPTSGAQFFIKGGSYTSWTKIYDSTIGSYTNWQPYIANYDAASALTCDFFRIYNRSLPEDIWKAGPNLLSDPGLEANYTAGKCDTLTEWGNPVLWQSTDVHGGYSAQQFMALAPGDDLYFDPPFQGTALKWYRGSTWAKRLAGDTGSVYPSLYDRRTGFHQNLPITSTDWQKYEVVIQASYNNDLYFLPVVQVGDTGFDTVIVDDCQLAEVTLNPATTKILDAAVAP